MQEPTNIQDDLFATGTDESPENLRRLHRLSVYLFVVSVLISILGLVLFLPTLKNIGNVFSEVTFSKAGLQMLVSVVYTVVFIVLFPVQMFYYFKFAKAIRIQNRLSTPNPLSANYLLMNAKISCVTFTVNLIYFIIFTYTEWSMYR